LIWFRQKKKIYRSKHRSSGQVWVILLLGIVGLLVAVKVARDTGETNIAITCADNAADTGSLTAASCMAAAFNRTVYRNWRTNSREQAVGLGHGGIHMGHPPFRVTGYHEYYYYKEMRLYFELMRLRYLPFRTKSNEYLDEAAEYIDSAITKIEDAEAIIAGLPPLECIVGSMGPACGVLWMQLVTEVKPLLESAADDINKAAHYIGGFNVLAAYKGNGTGCEEERTVGPPDPPDPCENLLICSKRNVCQFTAGDPVSQGLTYWFRENQAGHVCQAFGYLKQARREALKTAQQMSIQNSCYTDKLSDSQRDDFNFWMGGGSGEAGGWESTPGGGAEGDGGFNPCGDAHISFTPPGGGCSIDVTLEIPTIQEYTMRTTAWGFPADPTGSRTRKSLDIECTGCDDEISIVAEEFMKDPFDYKVSKRIVDDLLYEVEPYIRALAVRCDTIYQLTIQGASCCCCTCGGVDLCGSCENCGECCDEGPPDPVTGLTECLKEEHAICDYETPYIEAERQRQCLITNINCFLPQFTKILDGPRPLASIAVLKDWNNRIWTYVWNTPGTKEATDCMSVTCAEANPANVHWPGMMVTNIHDVTLSDESWQTDCLAVSSCGASRHSKSKFCGRGWPCGGKGDLLGAFRDRYESEITVAD